MRRLCVLLLPSLALAPGASRAETIERVVAKVNGQIITLSEFQSRQIAAAQGARVDPAGVSRVPAPEQRQDPAGRDRRDPDPAKGRGLPASARPRPGSTRRSTGIKKENKITSDEQMQEALAREGLTLAELRANIERGVLRRIVMQRDVQPKIEASDADVRAEYETAQGHRVHQAGHGHAAGDPDPRGQGRPWRSRRELVGRARAGEDFAGAGADLLHGALARQRRRAGAARAGRLHPDLEKVAFELAVGSVSDPLPVAGGYRLIRVVAKTTGSTTPFDAVKDRVRDRVMMTRFDKAYDEYVAELRKNASVELRVREVPLQLTGPIPEGSLREALEPLTPGGAEPAAPEAPAAAQPAAAAPAAPAAATPAPVVVDDEVTTTPQAAPERVAPPPRATTPPTTPPTQTAAEPAPAGAMTGADASFFERVYALVRRIPRGRVATYGQVAALLGVPRGARAVGWALRGIGARAARVPWHRVVGQGGRISLDGRPAGCSAPAATPGRRPLRERPRRHGAARPDRTTGSVQPDSLGLTPDSRGAAGAARARADGRAAPGLPGARARRRVPGVARRLARSRLEAPRPRSGDSASTAAAPTSASSRCRRSRR